MKLERISAVLLAAGALGAGFMGCGDDNANGSGGSAATTTSGPTTTSAVATTTSSGTAGDPFLALSCGADSECGMNGRCILPTDNDSHFFDGGPAGGYCTRSCSTDGECGGAGNLCLKDQSGDGICVLGCQQGSPDLEYLNSPLDIEKCRARDDLRCDVVEGLTVCMPSCGVDTQCEGRACDPRFAVCVDTPHTGLPSGAECVVDNNMDPCAGICVNFSVVQMCTNVCVAGGDLNVDCGGPTNGVCAYRLIDPTGTGDVGLCAKACLKHDDCLNPDLWCFGVQGLTGDVVPNGYCFGGATQCPNGQSACQAGETCTDTPYGRFCLEDFPLSDGAGGSGGGGTGGGGTGGAGGSGTGGAGGAGGN